MRKKLSKYKLLWEYVQKNESWPLKLTFEQIHNIIGVPVDHSFLKYKKELTEYGYQVGKISMKEQTVIFDRMNEIPAAGTDIEEGITETFQLLFDKNNNTAYKALQSLKQISEESNVLYGYMDRLRDMLDSSNSYVRIRGLTLIAYNARWDKDYKIDEMLDAYLKHITDSKPITARQCIKLLPVIAKHKTELREDILKSLENADVSFYAESMRTLVYQDIKNSLDEIQKL